MIMISSTGVFVSLLLALLILPRLIYFSIVNIQSFDNSLFKGRYLFYFVSSFIFALISLLTSLFFSYDFLNLGIFIVWMLLIGLALSLYLLFWSVFIMRGSNSNSHFKKIIIICPLTFLEAIAIVLTSVFTMNYYLLILGTIYLVFSYLWNIHGYNLTK